MLLGTPEEVRQSAWFAIETLGQEGGLILAPDQPLAYPSENLTALVETARKSGEYPRRE
jgi:hypothetical protein